MSQQFNFSTLVSNRALTDFKYSTPLIMTADRGCQTDFENKDYQPGDFVNIRYPNLFIAQEGNIMPPEAIQETAVPLPIQPLLGGNYAVDTNEASLFMTKNDELYHQRYISPVIRAAAASIETKMMNFGIGEVNYFTGTPNSSFSSFTQVDTINAKMALLGMPTFGDASVVLSPIDMSYLKSDNQNAFNQTLNTDISFYSRLGRYSRFNLYQTSMNLTHTAGTGAGAPVMASPVTAGFLIPITGFTPSATAVIRAGDTITFGSLSDATGVQSMNPTSHQPTGMLMPVTVAPNPSTLDGSYNADGSGNVTITIQAPAIGLVSDPANQRQNINQPIPSGATVNILGAGGRYKIGYAFTARGLAMVFPKLPHVSAVFCALAADPENKISFRITKQWDGLNGLQAVRTDILWGGKWFDQFVVKLISKVDDNI